ncbi:hypothetical protein IGI96_002715 [Enterococcus sp. DIV0421]|uniref:glycosyltransferase family 4 protein n=1 Tax=Enterococcus sp. DIV0421 TaxID=2774688 RepID=UPI003F22235C
MIKVLHICSEFNSSNLYDNYFKELNNYVENEVIVPVSYKTKYEKNENIIFLPCFNPFDRISFYYKSGKILKAVMNQTEVTEYDIIQAHTLFTNGNVAYNLHIKYGLPYIVTIRNTDINIFLKYKPYLKNQAIKILKKSQAIIFLSESYRKKIINVLNDKELSEVILNKSSIIPNGIDSFFIDNINLLRKNNVITNKVNLITVGKIEKNKNQLSVCKSIEKIRSFIDIEYVLVGPITDKVYFDKVNSYSFVKHLGVLDKQGVIDALRESHIFVMPSRTETFGLSYVESISQNVPVIYSKNEGFDGQFEEGVVGFSTDPNSTEEIACSLKQLLSNYSKFSNIGILAERFSWKEIVKEYYTIMSKITKEDE